MKTTKKEIMLNYHEILRSFRNNSLVLFYVPLWFVDKAENGVLCAKFHGEFMESASVTATEQH